MLSFASCFFRTEPLASWDDPLYYPSLLNCLDRRPHNPSWLCLGNQATFPSGSHLLRYAQTQLWEAGFNPDGGIMKTGWAQCQGCDPRLETTEAWEKATRKDPLFVLDVKWPSVKTTLRKTFNTLADSSGFLPVSQESQVANIIHNLP
jgi:hypothetical protein